MELLIECLKAFAVGGLFCVIGQILIDRTKLTPARILTSFVVAGVVLGALGLYQPLADWAGAGARYFQKTGGDDIIGALVPYCRKTISAAHLKGFMMAPWTNLQERGENYDRQMKAIDLFAAALDA